MFTPAHLRVPQRDRAILGGLLVGLAVAAWVALWWWETSPYAGYMGHAGTVGPLPLEASLFVVGWVLMIVAMMLPSSVPLVMTFGALVGRRPRPGRLVGLLLLGYLAVWGAFGLAAWVADRGIHAAVEALPWLAEHPQLIMGTTLLAAGLWQFSPLRERCLEACRSPLGFVVNRWRGTSPLRESFAMGVAHGAFCVGCCWALMFVMFAAGVASLVWMALLTAVMVHEKTRPEGRRLVPVTGLALLATASVVLLASAYGAGVL